MLRLLRRLDVVVALSTFALCIFIGNRWLPSFMHRTTVLHRLTNTRRDLVMILYLSHPTPALVSEKWSFHDLDGYSRVRYTVAGPRGEASVTEPPSPRVDVPALFDAAKNDGLLHAPRGVGSDHIFLALRLGKVWEQRDLYFSSGLLARSRRREYHLDLAHRSISTLPLLELESTPSPGKATSEFLAQVRAFGTPAFRAACLAARDQVERR